MRMNRINASVEIDCETLGEKFRFRLTSGTRLSVDCRRAQGALATGVVELKRVVGEPGGQGRSFGLPITFATTTDNRVEEIDLTASGYAASEIVVEVTTTESDKKLILGFTEDDPA